MRKTMILIEHLRRQSQTLVENFQNVFIRPVQKNAHFADLESR